MREIKFRAISLCRGEHWVYGDLRHYNRNPHTEKWTIYDPNTGIETDIDETTIGQFTGLYDKNSKEIYEGDVVRQQEKSFDTNYVGKVYYNKTHVAFMLCIEDNIPLCLPFITAKYDYEVVDNIYDNPELI